MTQARGMGPLPRVVRDEAGERALAALLRRHDFPDVVVGEPDARVPLADMVALFEDAARLVGDPFLGLRVGRSMHVTDYGSYIRHAAAGRTLAGGIDRAVRGIRYYQGAGALRLSVSGDEASFTYRQYATSRDAGRQHADHVLPGVLGFVRGFLGESWRPHTGSRKF